MRTKVALVFVANFALALIVSGNVARSADQSSNDAASGQSRGLLNQRPLDRLRQIFGGGLEGEASAETESGARPAVPRSPARAAVTTARPQMTNRRSPRTASRVDRPGLFSRPRTNTSNVAPLVEELTSDENPAPDATPTSEVASPEVNAATTAANDTTTAKPTVTLARQSATLSAPAAGETLATTSYESLILAAPRPVTPREIATLQSQSRVATNEAKLERAVPSLTAAQTTEPTPESTPEQSPEPLAKPQTTLVSAEPAAVPPTTLAAQPSTPSPLLASDEQQPQQPFEVGLSPTPRLIPQSPVEQEPAPAPPQAVTTAPVQPQMRTTTIVPRSTPPVIVPAAPRVEPTQVAVAPTPVAPPPAQPVAIPAAPRATPESVYVPQQGADNVVAVPANNASQTLRRVETPRPAPPAVAQLTATMIGPREIYFGDTGIFKVVLVNEGNAPAKEVRVEVLADDALMKTLNVGTIPAKTDVEVEIALAPNKTGSMELRASASGSDGVKAIAGSVVFVGKPELSLAIAGPPQLIFGDLKLYTAILNNTGNADARNVSVLVMLQGEQAQTLPVGIVPAGQTRQVRFELRPEQAGQLSVNAVATADGNVQAVANGAISVLRHEVQLAFEGPRQLLFGDKAVYTLTICNQGNTDAENVVVNVTLGDSVLDRLYEGTLAPGKQEKISFEVSPSKPGFHALRAVALGAGDLKAATTAKLQVQHGQLEVKVESPSVKFAGAEATYTVRVKNIGDATAADVLVTAHLPQSIKYLGGVDRIEFYEGVTWRVGNMTPGQEETYQVQCELSAPGEQKLVFNATGADQLEASQTVTTAVEALADVRLFVADPQGLVPVGQDVVYEIEVHNRGVKPAQNVEVVMQLSESLEPIHVEGADAQIQPRGVVFDPIARLAAKETIKLRVTARASEKGSHQYRVEMTADEPKTFMASEGTTRFYGNTIEPVALP